MTVLRAGGLALVLMSVALVGCLGGDEQAPVRSFSATGGMASDGYAYDGAGLVDAGATLDGAVHAPDSAGGYTASFEFAGSTWEVTTTSFSGQEEWKEGGVAFGLVEHGDSGTSTPVIPTIDGAVVTYGEGEVLRDGEPAGPGSGPWSVHLMLSETTIRGPDGLITQEDGTTPYDPNQPGNARIIQDDAQGLLQLTAPAGQDGARAPAPAEETVAFQGPESNQSVVIPGDLFASAVVNVTASAGDAPVGLGELQISLLDGQGNEVTSDQGQVTPAEDYTASFPVDAMLGDVSVELTGQGAFQVEVQATVTFDDHPFIILTWDEYTLEDMDELPDGQS